MIPTMQLTTTLPGRPGRVGAASASPADPDPAEVVGRMLVHYLRRDYERCLGAFASDVELVTQLERFHGPRGVVAEARRWDEIWDDHYFEVESLTQTGDQVLLLYRQTGRAKTSGIDTEERAGWIYTLCDGLIVRVQMFGDRESALTALARR
jgi:ketosteroid isomerase-like protein